jgi:pectin methylesterase-like acyl-CoA thioesterase
MEIIAGLPKPNKCCLEDQSGIRYSYGQKTQQASSSRPIVYPKDGNPNTDCGFGSAADIAQIGNFCGIRLPVADYKINCTVS